MTGYNKTVDTTAMPDRIRRLPISPTGFPVPWFVAWFVDGGQCEAGVGAPDFRVIAPGKMRRAFKEHRCWVCGGLLGAFKASVIGPMCSINRVISEPPSHKECAIYAARVCPFLANPAMRRNERGLYEDGKLVDGFTPAAGEHILRNPGAVCVWITRASPKPFQTPDGGVLFRLPPPTETLWFAEGRPATREEVLRSIESGYPTLEKIAAKDGVEAERQLEKMCKAAMALVPA
jgi:hypothetical protein